MADGAEHHDEDERREGHVEGDEVESELFEHAEILGRELRCTGRRLFGQAISCHADGFYFESRSDVGELFA